MLQVAPQFPGMGISQALSEVFTIARIRVYMIIAAVLAALIVLTPTFAQSDTIEIDTAPLFTSINTYIPVFFAIFAVVGGIMAAMAIARYIINAIVGAFSGRTSF